MFLCTLPGFTASEIRNPSTQRTLYNTAHRTGYILNCDSIPPPDSKQIELLQQSTMLVYKKERYRTKY